MVYSNLNEDFPLDEMFAFSGIKKWLSDDEWKEFEKILEKKNPVAFYKFKDSYEHPEKYL